MSIYNGGAICQRGEGGQNTLRSLGFDTKPNKLMSTVDRGEGVETKVCLKSKFPKDSNFIALHLDPLIISNRVNF